MPTRAISIPDELYMDVHLEMKSVEPHMSFSQVIVRRLNKLKEIESKEVNPNAE